MSASSNGRERSRLGEVIETSTVGIWVESDHLHELPPLGSVVQVGTRNNDTIFAIVSFGETAGMDSTRRAIRRGSDDVRDLDVYNRHPELSQILRTTFQAVPVAYQRAGEIHRLLPPLPPPLHYSVEGVDRHTLCALTDDPIYLTSLVHYSGEVPADQLIAAHVRTVRDERGGDTKWVDRAAQEIARMFKRDYARLLPILTAMDPSR